MKIGFEHGLARSSTAIVAVAGAALGMPNALANADISSKHVRPQAITRQVPLPRVSTAAEFSTNRRKPETPAHRMTTLAQDLGNKIVRLSQTSDVTTSYFHGKKNDPIGYAVSVAETLVEPGGSRVSYDFGVAYGKTHGIVDRSKILELDFSADKTRTTNGAIKYTGPNEDFVFTYEPRDHVWDVEASYNQRTAKQTVHTYKGSTDGSYGEKLTLAAANLVAGTDAHSLIQTAENHQSPHYMFAPR